MSTAYRMLTSTCLTVALLASICLANIANADPIRLQLTGMNTLEAAPGTPCSPAAHCAPAQSSQALTRFFTYILNIPDTVLQQGDAATDQWIRSHPRGGGANAVVFHSPTPSAANPYRCTLAVGALLVTTALPALKILKLKRYIEAIGGVAQTVRLVIGATSAAEKSRAVLVALGGLIAELTGIATVNQYCFS